MKKRIHTDDCDCYTCMMDYLEDKCNALKIKVSQLETALKEEKIATYELSQYKSAQSELLDVVGIKQQVASRCIEIIKCGGKYNVIDAIKLEFGL